MPLVCMRMRRIELALELALMGVILELFHRGIRPALDIGCGSSMSQLSDDLLALFSGYRLTMIVPVAVALIETHAALRPWVKRTVRLGSGFVIATMLLSYAISVWSFVR